MRIDLDTRLSIGFIFGLVGLTVELVGGILGAPVNDAVVGGLVTLTLGTFGAGIVIGKKNANGEGDGD